LPGGPAAGYGVYAKNEWHTVRIGRPLAGPVQTSQRAVVVSFIAALEVAAAHRVEDTVITVNSSYVERGYDEWLDRWEANGWSKTAGPALEHADLWKIVSRVRKTIRMRNLRVVVVRLAIADCPELKIALSFAKYGVKKHCAPCAGCGLKLGYPNLEHDCMPTCKKCNNKRFSDQAALKRHNESAHSPKVPCRRCAAVFGSFKSRNDHERLAHDSMVHPCGYCTAFFLDEEDAAEHEIEECQYIPFCRHCGSWFSSYEACQEHIFDDHFYI
jgi:ribonuclease HI